MTPEESVLLIRYVRALCPQQKVDEFTPDAWFDILAPYSAEEIRAAIAAHVSAGNAFIAVGEIVTEIRRARNDRLDRHTEAHPPVGDTDDASYRPALLAERRAIADGHAEPSPVPALPPGSSEQPIGRARAILAAVGNTVPGRAQGVINPRAVLCPRCYAQPGRSCTPGTRRRADVHPGRLVAARLAAAGLPPADPAEEQRVMEQRLAAARSALAATSGAVEPEDDFDPRYRTKQAAAEAAAQAEASQAATSEAS